MYVVTHKECNVKLKNPYIFLQVGAALHPLLGYLADNVGDNISQKNENFCELTGLYWIWKNSEADVIGLVHYRRFFYTGRMNALMHRMMNIAHIKRYMRNYDLIVPKKTRYSKTIRAIYSEKHHAEDWQHVRGIICELYAEYLETFDKVAESKELYVCNMFCGRKGLLDAYCKWLFEILFRMERSSDISNYDSYNRRIYGFLAERLFTVWILKNRIRCKEILIYNTEEGSMLQQTLIQPLLKKIKSILKGHSSDCERN